MKLPKSCLVTLLLGVLLLVLGSGALAFYQEHKTRQTVQMLERQVSDPAWRDQFEKDYKPEFEKLFQGDPDTYWQREKELETLLQQRFPDASRVSFRRRDTGYSARIFFGRAGIAYIAADPAHYRDFVSSHETISATYPRFVVLWYPWD
ncbi:MAG: hypothetical protein EOP88_10590 [Verrucomicrobiaceae bacterium]|nr:MAG: hypothetical protein EOP88_10590 [Verrucomicrobiaceae bacterium]